MSMSWQLVVVVVAVRRRWSGGRVAISGAEVVVVVVANDEGCPSHLLGSVSWQYAYLMASITSARHSESSSVLSNTKACCAFPCNLVQRIRVEGQNVRLTMFEIVMLDWRTRYMRCEELGKVASSLDESSDRRSLI